MCRYTRIYLNCWMKFFQMWYELRHRIQTHKFHILRTNICALALMFRIEWPWIFVNANQQTNHDSDLPVCSPYRLSQSKGFILMCISSQCMYQNTQQSKIYSYKHRSGAKRERRRESSVAHKRNTMLDISFFDLWFAGSQCESHWMWNIFAHTSLLSIRHSWNCTKGIGFMFIWSVKFIYLLFCLVEVATINKTNRNELNSATIHNECCRSRK